ncbi:MAG TPA: galactofuranose ABC transporter, permease protein YjfF [Micromonosporaceae bacterium]|nr:galactofuranose ABC transporter, permease protein YjfF [Micromonosporaceae bacterium]
MTTITPSGVRVRKVFTGRQQYVPVLATLVLLVVMFAVGAARYENFLSGQVILNLFINNSFLLVVAIGMTFVILTGGIDLSVGAVVALSTMITAELIQRQNWPTLLVFPVVILICGLFGTGMGAIIHYFEIQPFIVTLAGMFLARGLCFVIDTESITIRDPLFRSIARERISLGPGLSISTSVVIALLVLALAIYLLHYSRLGRNVYAIGGNEQSALLMGLPVARTKIAVYTISGICSGLGGVLLAFYTRSGYSLNANGLELDAIASVVIGGTLLTGGTGFVIGTVLGVLVNGVIQTIINFQGDLSSWWTRIVIGALLLAFILLQRVVGTRKT